jgi:hypothetical protein
VNIGFGSTVQSNGTNRRLSINDGGTTTLAGAVGGTGLAGDKLASLSTDAAGTTAINGGSVSTTGTQTYGGAVSLGADTTLSGVGITLGSTVKSNGTARSLTINDSGATTLTGAIGGTGTAGDKLASLTTDAAGSTALNGATVLTTGTQTYGDAVTLGADTTLTGAGITLSSTVQSNGTNRSLTINDSGATTLTGAIGGTTTSEALTSLTTDAAGSTALNGATVLTTGTQTYGDAVTLGTDTTLTGSTVTTQGSVTGNNKSLSITGNAVLGNDAPDSVTGLSTLTVSGTTGINTTAVTTTGAQSYTGAVTLGENTTLTGSSLQIGSTLAGAGKNLTLTGDASIGGDVSLVNTLNVSGTTRLGGNVSTTGSQNYGGELRLTSSAALTARDSNITVSGPIDANAPGAQGLTIAAGTGNVRLAASVGANQPLSSLVTSAASTVLGTSSDMSVTTTGLQRYDAQVGLQSNTVLNTTGTNSTGGDLFIAGALDTLNGLKSLSVTAGNGSVTLAGDLGTGQRQGQGLSTLSVEAGTISTRAIAATGQITLAPGVSGTVAGVVSGLTATLDKSGAGVLTLAENNSYGGNTSVQSGTLTLQKSRGLGSTGNALVASGATLDLQGVALEAQAITLNGGMLSTSAGTNSFAGLVSLGANSLVRVEGSQLELFGPVAANGHGLVLAGSGDLQMNNPANSLSSLATLETIGSVQLANQAGLVLGQVSVGGNSYAGISSAGQVKLLNVGELTIANGAFVNTLNGPVVLTAGKFINNAGSAALRAGGNNAWQVWSTNADPYNSANGDVLAGLPNDFVQYNASYGTTTVQGVGNGLLHTLAPVLTVSLNGLVSKTYDGNTLATLEAANYSVSGAVNADSPTLNNPVSGIYTSAGTGLAAQDAGDGKIVSVSGLTITPVNGSKPVYGYTLSSTSTTGMVGAISKAPIGITFEGNYSGTTVIDPPPAFTFTITGLVNGETITELKSVTVNNKDVSKNNVNFVTSMISGGGTAQVENYQLTFAANSLAGTSQNAVKLKSPMNLVILPPALPVVAPTVAPQPLLMASSVAPSPAAVPASNVSAAPTATAAATTTATTTDTAAPASTTAASSSAESAVSATATSTTATEKEADSDAKSTTSTASSTTANATTALATPAAAAPGSGSTSSGSQLGVRVTMLTTPTNQTSGMVTVVLPQGTAGNGSSLQIALPPAITARAQETNSPVTATLANNQPLPAWIRFDPGQKAFVIAADARATFPISVVLNVGSQRTVVVVSESALK